MASCIAKPSATVLLTVQIKRVFLCHEEGFQVHTLIAEKDRKIRYKLYRAQQLTLPEGIIVTDGYGWETQSVAVRDFHVDWLGAVVQFYQIDDVEE